MVHFTVAICTYNGENRLPQVLDALQCQCNTEHLSWEIFVVDNNSQDNTAQVVRDYQKKWAGCSYRLEYCLEAKQGAGFARKRAIKEANSPVIGFLDDDNIPTPDWVAAAYTFSKEHPAAGAWGSQIHGDFEGKIPPKFKLIQAFFAITERGSQPVLYDPKLRVLPPSAGLVVRKEAWQNTVPSNCILNGRVPGSMLTSEDLEILSYIQQAGWEIWYNPAMELQHKIPRKRLERSYLMSFFRGIGLSRHVTRMLSVKPKLRPLAFAAYLVNDLRKIVLHSLQYGTHLKEDVVAACLMELFVGSLISPFYLWKNGYLTGRSLFDFTHRSELRTTIKSKQIAITKN